MDRLKYHQERLDAKLGFKRDENYRYDFDPVVPENVLDHQENDGIVPKNQQKNTQYHLGFQTGATFDVDESYKESNAYKKYMQTRPEVLEEAKKISDTTGIPYDAIIEDSESMAKAREIYDYKKKVMDFSKVYERYPELKKLNEADGAISLHNIQDVKRVHGDFEAIKVGWNTDSLAAERNILGFDKFLGKQVDEKQLEALNKQYQELKEIPTLDEDISMAILGNSAQQARMMVRHFVQSLDTVALGATAGAIGNAVLNRNNIAMAPALITGARTALPVAFKTGMAIEMFKESAGSSYLTYIGYKDKFGNQLLSDSEARVYAAATALIETRIEFANYGAVIDILKGSKKTIGAAKVIENIVKNSKDAASVVAQLKTWLSTNAKNLGAVAFGESVEEGAQQISEMGISQIARVNNPEGNIPQYSGSDILKGGVEAAVAAFPASIGLGGMAVGASGLRFTRHAAQLLSLGKERADKALRTQTGVNLLNSLMQAAQDTKLGANHKETFNKLMKSNLEGTVHETAYVDSELLLEEEGGIEVFNQLAAAAGYTEEQINTLRETGAPVRINTADVVSTIAGASEINIADYVSFDAADRCFARNKKVAKELDNFLKVVKTKEVERVINNINTLATEVFGETEERDLATMIIAEFEDPIAGIEERRREINQEIDEMINPVVEKMRGGMGQGVELYETDDYGNVLEKGDHDSHVGGAVRLSNNDPWYTKYYKANKKRPSEKELRELAEEVITGNNEYGVGDYDYSDPAMVEYGEENKARLDNLRHELELLANIEPKLKDVNKGDFAALDGLSEDGVKVYKAMYDLFRNAPIKKQQKAASMNALIYANVAERWAESHKLLGNKKVTPLDFMKRVRVEFGGEVATGAHNQYGGLEEAENRLREDEANFAKAIDLFMENKLEVQTTRVMRTPLVMELVGAQVLPVDITVKNLNKILKRKHADDITPELLKQIPRAMTDPLMIFDTYAGKRNQVRKVIVLDLKTDNGAVVIVPFELNTLNNKNNYVMNEVLSVYGKTDKNTGEASNVWLENQLKESKLQYINKKRASEVLDNEKLLSLMPYLKNGSSSSQIIADEEDLRKLRAINKGFYQVANKLPSNTQPLGEQQQLRIKELNERINELENELNPTGTYEIPVFQNGTDTVYIGKSLSGNLKITKNKTDAIPIGDNIKQEVDEFIAKGTKKYGPLKQIGVEEKTVKLNIPYSKQKKIKDELLELTRERDALSNGFESYEAFKDYEEKEHQKFLKKEKETNERNLETVKTSYFHEKARKGEPFYWQEHNGRIECSYQSAARTIVMEAKRMGAIERYASSSKGSKFASSIYLQMGDNEIRISNHDLPLTDKRMSADYNKRWDGELILDNYALIKLAEKVKSREDLQEFIKSLFETEDFYKNEVVFNQTAWVGSGAVFDTFDVGYIGTGEGGIMHGWGLYSAKSKKVAQKYKKLVGGKNGALYEVDVPEYDVLLDEQKMFKDQDGNVKKLLVGAVNNLDQEQKTRFWERMLDREFTEDSRISMAEFDLIRLELNQDAFNQIVNKFVFVQKAAHKRLLEQGYTEEQIKEFAENQELANKEKTKFDADIERVKANIEALKKEDELRRANLMQKAFDNPAGSLERIAGEQMYMAFTYAVSGKAYDYRMGSEYLNSQGIKGITYDGGEDGRCFVVFDDKAILVINRFNQEAKRILAGQTIFARDTGERVIKLFESADESTFIHEMAHVAYEDLRELASYENAPAQFKRDIKTLDDWANWNEEQLKEYVGTATYQEFAQMDALIREALGNGDGTRAEKLQRKWRQERFARGFEEYLKKGKAPTEGLRKVFYQFKTWLTKIYRAYRGIGGVPTKEVEAVMTRLLLTEDAIELAEKKAEIDAFEKSGVFNYLGDNAKAMWQKILEDVRKDATSKVLKIAMKDMSELAKRERQEKIDAERQAAYERMAKEPVWAVYSYLKYNPKMDTLAACKLFGLTVEEYVGLLKANGGSLERAVENYMANYIAELEAPKKVDIEARAEEAMTTSYYKLLLSSFENEMLQREVRREARLSKKLAGIVAKDETERAEIEKSLRELDKKGDEAKAQRALRDVAVGNVEKIRQYAKEKLAVMDISYSANPVVWKNASRQKAAEMTEALAKKDYNKAVFASKMRLVYDAMADIATENKKLVDRKSKQMRDRAKTIRREKNMGANDRYVYNHLLYAFGLAERDVPRPPQFTTFNEVLISYDSTLSMPFIGDNGELLISDFIINAGTGTGKAVKGIHELTVSEFTELANVMDNIYTVAVEANKIKTVKTTEGETITVDQALAEIMDDAFNRHKEKEVVDTTMAGNVKKMDEILNVANETHISVLKAETILDELSPKATKYIYDPIKRAAEKELKMTIEYGEKIEAIRQAWLDGKIEKYLNQGLGEDEARKAAEKEIEEAFTVERYKLGTSNITKENIIAFALNWGTEINRKRAMNYPGTTTRDYERIFAEMDGADWQFVTNVWDLFEETWPQIKQVEANVSGVTLEKQEGITFNVTGKDGANYIIQGKYYPIKYDPKKNQKVQRQQKEEGVRTNLPSMARMGVGIGMTKERAVSTSYLMRNDLGVFAEAIQENIHLICMREAVRDASRLINDERFADTIKRTLGGNALSALQDWVLDCWQLEPKVKNDFESAMAYLRRKQTTAVLAFRLSTALLNVANIGPVMHYLGMGRTKKALMDFYAHPIEQYNFVMERSAFVKNRAQTMDRDMRDVVKGKGIGDKMNKLEAMGFYMITKTDLMLACPLWLSEYQRVYRENAEQLSAEQIERMAVDAGDKAVRSVFGSGMVQDLAAVQRGGEVTKMLTMYYSYFSVVQQAISKSAFEYNRRKVNGDDWYKRWAPVANTIVLWLIIPSAISAIIKMGIEAATGDDDDEITFKNFIKRTGADTINAAAGGVPILRDVVNVAMAYAVEGKYYGARSTSIGETTEKMMDVIRSIKGFADDKKDLDDVLRAVFRATAYTTGIPVAGADALSTLYQWIAYGDATPEEIREYLTAILFDKKVKK